MGALASACASGALPQLQVRAHAPSPDRVSTQLTPTTCSTQTLWLHSNKIGDPGLASLAGACARRSLPQLSQLWLTSNQIGDPGCIALAEACGRGGLPQLTKLWLGQNQIGDAGISALASACASGALASLQTLVLDWNAIGDSGLAALATACGNGSLPQLTKLWLADNQIGDAGISALASACASGALPQLKVRSHPYSCTHEHSGFNSPAQLCPTQELYLHRNQIGDAGVSALARACASGALPQLQVRPHPKP